MHLERLSSSESFRSDNSKYCVSCIFQSLHKCPEATRSVVGALSCRGRRYQQKRIRTDKLSIIPSGIDPFGAVALRLCVSPISRRDVVRSDGSLPIPW